MIYITAVGLFARKGQAFPAAELLEDGWSTAPIGVSSARREQLCNLVPALRGLGPLELEGLGDGLTGDGELQRQAPGVQGGLCAWRARLLRAGFRVVGMREEGGDGRGDERGMQEGLQGARPLGVDGIQAVDRLVQPDAEFHLPAHADRKSTRLNSSHMSISYAVFCLKKKKKKYIMIYLKKNNKKKDSLQ